MQTSSALAFTTLLALVPLVTLVLSVADVVPYLNQLIKRLDFLIQENLLPRGQLVRFPAVLAVFRIEPSS